MKQCPRCNRTYADDTLSYCLQDGAVLISRYDPEATQISPFPPSEPTLVAYAKPTMPSPSPVPAPAPALRQRPLLAIGALVLAALAIGVSIGGFIFQRYSSPSSASLSTAPSPRALTTASATPRPAVSATPTPTPVATPSQSIVQSTPETKTECVLYNDMADKSVVRVRSNCDTQDCDNDSSTIAGEYPDNTPVRVIRGANVRGARFTWVKVVITSSGQTVWVASTKIKCN